MTDQVWSTVESLYPHLPCWLVLCFFPIISDKIIVRDSLDVSLYTNDWQYAHICGWSCLSPCAWTNRQVPRKHWECIWRLLQHVSELDLNLELLCLMAMCFHFVLAAPRYVSNVKQPMGLRSCRVLHGIPPSAKRRALAPWTSWHRGCALGGLLWCKQRHTLKCRRNHPRARSPVSVASIVACCLCLGSSSHWVHIWDCKCFHMPTTCTCTHLSVSAYESCINTGQMRRTM